MPNSHIVDAYDDLVSLGIALKNKEAPVSMAMVGEALWFVLEQLSDGVFGKGQLPPTDSEQDRLDDALSAFCAVAEKGNIELPRSSKR